MITSLELENFKGIGARQRIDFAPLTLLFGANNAGKSTILQALLYLHELLEHGDADVDRTELGGSVIEFGGFARLVHQHDLSRTMKIRVTFDTPKDLERFGRDLTDFPFPDLGDEVESAWLEVSIRHVNVPTLEQLVFRPNPGPFLEHVSIGINGAAEPLVELTYAVRLGDEHLVEAAIHLGHSEVLPEAEAVAAEWLPLSSTLFSDGGESAAAETGVSGSDEMAPTSTGSDDQSGALAQGSLKFSVKATRRSSLPHFDSPVRLFESEEDDDERRFVRTEIQTFLEMVISGTTAQLASDLRDSLYIGPLRAIPPRGYLYERVGRQSSWADGLAAWDLLLSDRLALADRTNEWLERLGAACGVVVQQLTDATASAEAITVEHVDATLRRLLLDTGAGSLVLPQEVGAGISQVVPVIVAAIADGAGMLMVEQPELHVHPGLQVGLGDLFIEASKSRHGRGKRRRPMVVETHSEHLILRVLRRIRQTTDGDLRPGEPEFSKENLSVVYVQKTPDGVRIIPLRVDDHGEFLDRWPKGFFGERAEELF